MNPSDFKNLTLRQYLLAKVAALKGNFNSMRGTNVLTFILYGLLFDVVNNLWRPFSVMFLGRLGGGELEISLLSALPGLVGAAVLLPGALIFRRFTDKQRATAAFILISRGMLLLFAVVPFVPPQIRPILFVVLVAIMNCPDALGQTSLQSFLGRVFDGHVRGQAIALRTKFGQAIIPLVTILTGLIITFVPRDEAQRMMLYQAFFVGAFLVGIAEVVVFRRLQVSEDTITTLSEEISSSGDTIATPSRSFPAIRANINIIRGISRDRRFRLFLAPAICFAFTWQAAWPLVSIHQAITLGATEMWFAIFALVSGIFAFISGGFWQGLLRRRGNQATLIVAALLLSFNAVLIPLAPSVGWMAVVSAYSGFSAIGINAAFLNGALEATPDENRMIYLAFYNTCMNVSLFISPFFAYFLQARFGNSNALFVVGGMRLVATGVLYAAGRRTL